MGCAPAGTAEPLQAADQGRPGAVGVAVRGPASGEAQGPAVDASWPGLPGVDLLGETIDPPSGIPIVDRAAYEATRIEAGVPVMGAELTDRTIPAETGIIDRTVSFTKGC